MLEPAQGSAKSHFSLPACPPGRAAPPRAPGEVPIDRGRGSMGWRRGWRGGRPPPRRGPGRGEQTPGQALLPLFQPRGTAGEVGDRARGWVTLPATPMAPPCLPNPPPAQGAACAAADGDRHQSRGTRRRLQPPVPQHTALWLPGLPIGAPSSPPCPTKKKKSSPESAPLRVDGRKTPSAPQPIRSCRRSSAWRCLSHAHRARGCHWPPPNTQLSGRQGVAGGGHREEAPHPIQGDRGAQGTARGGSSPAPPLPCEDGGQRGP